MALFGTGGSSKCGLFYFIVFSLFVNELEEVLKYTSGLGCTCSKHD